MYRAHLRFLGCFSRIFGRLPRTAEAALAMHLHCLGVLCTLIGHMERPHPPGTRLEAALGPQTWGPKTCDLPVICPLGTFGGACGRLERPVP